MSASRGGRLSRKRKKEEESQSLAGTSIHDITDDFQDAATVFRVPKKAKTEKPQPASRPRGRPKRSNTRQISSAERAGGSQSLSEKSSPEIVETCHSPTIIEPEIDDDIPELVEDDKELLELEQSVCSESEKLCPCCKHIVPAAILGEHFKECMQKFVHVKRRSQRNKNEKNDEVKEQKETEVLPCPVCLKFMKSKAQRKSHVKGCATSHGLTSEQLIMASRLQEKQANERNLLGLPSPVPQTDLRNKNKSEEVTSEVKERLEGKLLNKEAKKDPDLAMALALSRSLVEEEAEQRASREEKLVELGLHNIVEEDRKAQPLLLVPPETGKGQTKGKGRKKNAMWRKAILANRSQAERENIISEKVAAILASEDVHGNDWEDSSNGCRKTSLTRYRDKNCSLWGAAHSDKDQPLKNFYVPDLEPYIVPKEVAVGNLLRSLSQIPGRLNITTYNAIDENSDSESDGERPRDFAMDGDTTQSALAELLGSQEYLDITRAQNVIESEDMTELREFEDPTLDPNITVEAASGFWIHHLPGENSESLVASNKDNEKKIGNGKGASERTLGTEDMVSDETINNKSQEVSSIEVIDCDTQNTIDLASDGISESCQDDSNVVPNPKNASAGIGIPDNVCGSNTSNFPEISLIDEESQDEENVVSESVSEKDYAVESSGNIEGQLSINSLEKVKCNSHDENYNPHQEIPKKDQSLGNLQIIPLIQDKSSDSSMDSVETQIFFEVHDCSRREISKLQLDADETVPYADFRPQTSPFSNKKSSLDKTELKNADNDYHENKDNTYITPRKVLLSCEQKNEKKEDKTCSGECLNKSLQPGLLNPLHAKLVYDWASILASGEGSDVSLTTSEGSNIHAHSLVILVRCPKLYQELQVSEKMIKWMDICFEGAHVFISYLYTGTCEIKAKDDPLWMDVFDLALKYECEDLVTYLESLYKANPSPVKLGTPVAPVIDINPNRSPEIVLTPKSHTFNQGGSIERNVRRCINLSPETDKAIADVLADEEEREQFSYTPKSALNTEEDDEKCSTNSPDLFDESHLSQTKTFCSVPARSTPMPFVPNQTSGTKTIRDECKDSTDLPQLELEEATPRNSSTSDRSPCSFDRNSRKESLAESVSPDTENSLKAIPITRKVNTTEKNHDKTIFCKDNSPKTSIEKDNDDDIIDLTHCSSGSSQSENGSSGNVSIPSIHAPDFQSDTEDMEPLKLGDGTDSDSHENKEDGDPVGVDVNTLQTSPKQTTHTTENDNHAESVNRSYISKIWDDYDDMGCEALPIDISPVTPVKPVSSSAGGASECEELQLLHQTESVFPKEKTPAQKETPYVNQPQECLPIIQLNSEDYSDSVSVSESQKPEFAISAPSVSDETLRRLQEDFEDSNIWKDDFDLVDGCSNLIPQKNTEKSLLKPVCETFKTPNKKAGSRKEAITPMPDYKNMQSPELKKELEKYGIRPISRRKATLLLQHVYEQTHPLVTDSEAESSFCETPQRPQLEKNIKNSAVLAKKVLKKTLSKKEKPTTKKKGLIQGSGASTSNEQNLEAEDEDSQLNSSQASSTSNDGSEFDCAEESLMVHDDDDEELSSTQHDNIRNRVAEYIRSDPELYHKVLLYEPIFVDELQASLKANGIKTNMNNLLEILDEQCITFRTQQGQRNRSRKRKSPKKKKAASPKKS